MTRKTITSHICRILLTSLGVEGCIVKESSSLFAGSSFINDANSSLLFFVLPLKFVARVLWCSSRALGSTFIL